MAGSLEFHAKNAEFGLRARLRMQRSGFNPSGCRLWSEQEVSLLSQFSGQYDKLVKLLPGRSRGAIRVKSSQLGLGYRCHRWTASGLSKLRRMYPAASKSEICAAFPSLSWTQIKDTARYYHLPHRRKRPYKLTGHPALDEVRKRCYEIGWTMLDLDKEARTGTYFSRCAWIRYKLNLGNLARAIEALDGVIDIKWS